MEIHPSGTARLTGRELHEPHKVRCAQCGMLNDDRRDTPFATGPGDGINLPDNGSSEFTVQNGCPFCGTHNQFGIGRRDAQTRRRALITDRKPGDDAIQ